MGFILGMLINLSQMGVFKALAVIFCLVWAGLSTQDCQVLIAGGTLAALGAATAAAVNRKVCLLEPGQKIGGQLGEQGVWHIDFNWLYQAGYPDNTTAYNHANLHPLMRNLTSSCNTGDCWVSRNCFLYSCFQKVIDQFLQPMLSSGSLDITFNSLVTSVERRGQTITSVTYVQRVPKKQDCRSADERIADWYSTSDSQYYTKHTYTAKVTGYVIEATQYGDVLALSKASYEQGTKQSDTCGQSIVFGLHQQYQDQGYLSSQQIKADPEDVVNEDGFSLGGYNAEQVWRYRRLKGSRMGAQPGQISLQNWNGPGNDYKDGYLFTSAKNQTSQWRGGLNYTTLRQAEGRSLRYHEWYKKVSGYPISLTGKYLNSCHGTTLLPYIRDGRRSVGYKNFILKESDVSGLFNLQSKVTGTVFSDRVALGFYNMDVHSIDDCEYQPYARTLPLPFFLPFRAMTNKDISNLVTVGRAMSQTFYTSTATRTHSTEFHSGVGAMAAVSYMLNTKINSTWQLADCESCFYELQNQLRRLMPIQWTVAGKKYPFTSQPTAEMI